ncbi:SusC/RagA family TonB-linked outer membrane protein [Niabella sp. CC-SYL272]|uniref:SusC/RagA family TonB-linked outer membrane protein n=1 Tax=Niabella agricola TaxID=2891571 RepID=UPI001F2DFA8B|nr:SusC/RagA family TonB-linked outer membrane protein [Niabella agricola]MCF3111294.1 SusC/RagA family TonB-linked outer membrane protein [Niabella agricola]
MKRKLSLPPAILLLLLFPLFLNAQQRQISGSVKNESGEPVPGATILQTGTPNAATTNDDGNFSMQVTGNNVQLEISSVSYISQKVSIGNNAFISVTLTTDQKATMEEVVVTALGVTRAQRSLGYATQQVEGKNLTMAKESNLIASLAGKISGAQIVGSSAANLGGTQKIKLRGINSLNGSGSPLLVVDGTPISNINFSSDNANGIDLGNIGQDINAEDVENVSVLKGPAASALYGLRGQYGVIMITTKKGGRSKTPTVSLNAAYTIDKVGNFLPLQNIYGVGNNQTFLKLPNGELYVNGNDESWGPKMDGTPVRMYYSFYKQDPEYGKATPFLPQPNNIKDFFVTGHNINNSISVSGGGDRSTYKLSYTNNYIKGTYPNTFLKRNNLGLNAALNVTDKLTVGTNVNYANNLGQRPVQGYQGSFTGATQWFQRNIDIHRLKNYKYADGTILNWNVNPNTTAGIITNNRPSDWNNPYFDAYENLNSDSRDRLFGDVNVKYQILPELRLSGFVRGDIFMQKLSQRTAVGGRLDPGYSEGKYQNKEINYELLAEYSKKWEDFSLNVNLGGNLLNTQYSYLSGYTVGGLSSPGWYSLEASVNRPVINQRLREKSVRSVYGMISAGYKDMLFIDGTLRNDVSSALPKKNNSYLYPSLSGSFVFSELLHSGVLSFGKLRASYASAGSDLDPYQILDIYAAGSIYATPSTTINTMRLPIELRNADIKPAYANSFEIGTELRFLKNRIGLDVTYYEQVNKNQILPLQISAATGFTNAIINAGRISNKGVEVSVKGTPVQAQNFQWNTTLNFAKNKGMVDELYPGVNAYQLGSNTYSSQTIYLYSNVKQPFGTLVGPGYKKDAATGKILLDESNMPVQELNKNFGSVVPDFTGGFLNSFQFKQFDLNGMIDFQSGGKFFSWSQMLAVKSGQAAITAAVNDKGKNVRDPLADGGGYKIEGISQKTGEAVTTYVDARTYFRNNIGTRIYDEWLYDASYIKLREVSIGYNFSKKTLEKTPVKALRLALIARNPLMIWQKAPKGLDPSELSSGSASISWIEKGELQTVRSYGINLNITF